MESLNKKLKSTVTNNTTPFFGKARFILGKGSSITIESYQNTARAINGTSFKGGETVISGNIWLNLEAPDDADVDVVVDNKYKIYGFFAEPLLKSDIKIIDIDAFGYFGSTDSAYTPENNGVKIRKGTLDMNNKHFGYCDRVYEIGKLDSYIYIKNFDYNNDKNGLDADTLPNLRIYGGIPDRTVDIKTLGRLTQVTTLVFKPSLLWVGKLEELCNELLLNGKESGTLTIHCNEAITYNNAVIDYGKTATITFSAGEYTVSIS